MRQPRERTYGEFRAPPELSYGCFEEVSVSQPHWIIVLEGNLLDVSVVGTGDPLLIADRIRDLDMCSNNLSRDRKLAWKEGRGGHPVERVNHQAMLYHLLSLSRNLFVDFTSFTTRSDYTMSHTHQRFYVADTVAVRDPSQCLWGDLRQRWSQSSHILVIREKELATLMWYCCTRRSRIFQRVVQSNTVLVGYTWQTD